MPRALPIGIFQWIDGAERERRICPHIAQLIAWLRASTGSEITDVGLENPKGGDIVVFMSKSLDEASVLEYVKGRDELVAEFNGIGRLHSVACRKDYVRVTPKSVLPDVK